MWRGLEALESLNALVKEAGAEHTYNRCGVLRPCADEDQAEAMRDIAHRYPRFARWIADVAAEEAFAGVTAPDGALQLNSGGIVDTPAFINAVLAAAEDRGATLKTGAVVTSWKATTSQVTVWTRSGESFAAQHVLLCTGSRYPAFEALRTLHLHCTKGQVVRTVRPPGCTLAMPVTGRGYIVPVKNGLLVGTTYERGYASEAPTATASRYILRQASAMMPGLQQAQVVAAAAGVRVGVPGTRLPMVGPISERAWIFTGLGSKGLLLGAVIAQLLPSWLSSPDTIPPELRVRWSN